MRDLARGLDYLRDPIANWPALTGDEQDVLHEDMWGGGHTDTQIHRSLTDTQVL